MTYAFTLQVSGIDPRQEKYEDTLYEAGCDDALVAVIDGVLFLDFHREAASFEQAVQSARRNVERAGGKVVKVAPLPE